jgi:hypothetical protein
VCSGQFRPLVASPNPHGPAPDPTRVGSCVLIRDAYGFNSPSTVGISSETVGWMCMVRIRVL